MIYHNVPFLFFDRNVKKDVAPMVVQRLFAVLYCINNVLPGS